MKRKLSPERHKEILDEMELAEIFNEQRWAQRYEISIPTVRRLRRESRERSRGRLLIPNVSGTVHVVCFTTPRKGAKTA